MPDPRGRPELLFPLFAELEALDGVGPKTAKLFRGIGVETPKDLVLTLPLGLLVVLIWPDGVPISLGGITLAVISGAVTSGLGYALWYRVLPQLGATRAAVAQLTVPVIATVGGVVLLGETLTLLAVLATILVIGGVALSLRRATTRQ